MATDIELCNRALIRLGSTTINDFDTSGDKGVIANNAYTSVKEMLLTMHPWRFNMAKKQCGKLSTAPANFWDSAHQLPSDLITGPWAVYNTTDTDVDPITAWERFGNKIYSDEDVIVVDYRIEVSVGDFPWWFNVLVELALAANMGPAITSDQSAGLPQHYHQMAFGPPELNLQGGWFATCKKLNGQSTPNDAIGSTEITDFRFS